MATSKDTKVKDIDITKSGPMTFRDLQIVNQQSYNNLSPEFQSFSKNVETVFAPTSLYDARAHGEHMVQSFLSESSNPWGESMFDAPTATEAQFQELGDVRANNQPWYSKIGAGLAKGAVLAGTTFLDGTVGLVLGASNAISEDRWSGLWDNDFSKAMQSVNEWSEEILPNYYTKAEQEQPWYENIFTANFLGDKFIKNLGFAVGALYSGGVYSAGLKAAKLPQIIGTIAKSSKAPAMITTSVGATISAVNEGRIEALNNSKDWFELHKSQLDDKLKERLSLIQAEYEANAGKEFVRTGIEGQDLVDVAYLKYQEVMKKEREAYNTALGRLTEDRLKMGNADLLMNIPILMASNIIQFGKFYANGFKTARKTNNIVGRAGEYTAGTTKLGATLAITKGALSEGTEEISQKAASVISGLAYEQDVNNYYKAKIDGKAEQETIDWVKAFAQGINETVNEGSSWEEFFIGTLTGALGIPRFRSMRNKEGELQSPIAFEGGAINSWRDYSAKILRENEIANYMNNIVNSPDFKNYYQGLIRHNKYQNDMNRAAEEGDAFDFKNAEHAQLVSDISMFDNAGKLEDLKSMIETAFDTSDENLDAIIRNTTSINEEGKLIGPFSEYAIKEKDGTISSNIGNEESKNKIITQLTKNKDDIMNTVRQYQELRDNLDIKTGQQLSDEQLEELTWMKSQISNWSDRVVAMSGEIKSVIGDVLGNLEPFLRFSEQTRDFEGQQVRRDKDGKIDASLSEGYVQANENVKAIQDAKNALNYVRSQDDKSLAYILANNPKFVDGLIKTINELDETILDTEEKSDITIKLNDIVKLGNASKTYKEKLKEYLDNPQKQVENHVKAQEQVVKQETKKKSDDLKTSLSNAQNLQEFRTIVDNQDDIENRDSVLETMENEGNEMAKNYRETSQYNKEVRRVLNESDAESQVKQDAMKLLQDQFNNSENLEYLANPNSIYINNENAFDEDSGGNIELSATRFQEAQYELQRAMSQVNNDNKFKDRFSAEYKKPVEKVEGPARGDNRTTTGDSGTSTTPTVTSSESLPTTELPAGNVTIEMVNEENRKFNERVETPQRPSRDNISRFYRPAIPELHIEASKEGDFRAFDIVARERENLDFSEIYNYLRDKGAFDYLNNGNLKVGDEIGFMIDPEFEKRVEGMEWHKAPTIFLIDKKNGQVVGSLDEGRSVNNFEGLASLEEKVRREYANRNKSSELETNHDNEYGYRGKNRLSKEGYKNSDNYTDSNARKIIANYDVFFDDLKKNPNLSLEEYKKKLHNDKLSEEAYKLWKWIQNRLNNTLDNESTSTSQQNQKFIATPTTKVSKIMVGKIPYGNTERNLADIPNVSSEDRKPIFGIIKNGVLTTNNKIDDSLIIKPVDMSQKEGRLYLLIPNGAGKYSPAAIRVKHFNKEEFNLNDVTVSSTIIGEDIKNAINRLSTSSSKEDVSSAMQDLAQDLYMQDIMITWFDSRSGSGITISKKVRKPDGTYEKVIIEGKEQIKEDKYNVYFSTNKKNVEIRGIGLDITAAEGDDINAFGVSKNPEDIYNEILNYLISFNLPLQVSARRINDSTYNNRIISSGILTSNITNASVKSTWFTTNYFDKEGNLQQAINPASITPQPKRKIETPVGGNESAIEGTLIKSIFTNKSYYVDLKTNTIRDDQGRTIEINNNNEILFDLAWAQDNFGTSTVSSMMVDNKVLTPSGKVLDRNKQIYLEGEEAQDVKDTIAGRKREKEDRVAKSKEIISEIYENQGRVDKSKTDIDFYYILEDDGKYHQYSRVHTRLGSNWVESAKQKEALTQIRTNLSKFVDDITQYNNYLKFLENKYKINLESYQGKNDIKNRDTIVNIVRDLMSGTNSMRALNAGLSVDSIIRQYFTLRDVSKIEKPSNMLESAFIDLITILNKIKTNMELMGERFLTDNIVLFQKYPDGTRVAGEVDILSIDKEGNFRIYDVKTSRYSFYDFTDRYNNKVNYFNTPSATQIMSAKDYYTLQLSAYKNLFESQYGVPVTKLAIMPFVLSYDKENVSSIQSEKGIPIAYNSAVSVPLASTVKVDISTETPDISAQAQAVLPIFETSLEIQNPIEGLTPEHSMDSTREKVGYFEIENKLYKGYVIPLTTIDGVEVYVTKIPNITKGFGRANEVAHVASNSFYAVFPNGKTFLFLNNNPVQGGMNQSQVEDAIKKGLEANPQRVKNLSSEKTILFDPDTVSTVSNASTSVETPATINQSNTLTGAAYTSQKEQAVNNHDEEFEEELTLRKVSGPETTIWNQEKELNWLSKVLPQLSENDRVKVVKGLIKVGKKGILAWGQFDKGVITLSDVAAEGTTYHEAFHVVFNLLLDNNERQSLYDEAKRLYGEKDNLSLEEDMAEGFRDYVITRQNRNLGKKIIDFFKELFIKVTHWNSFRPSLLSYYRMINAGEYANSTFKVHSIKESRAMKEQYTEEMREILANAPRDKEGRLLAPNGKPSNLNERQYTQVRSKAFKRWFGDWERFANVSEELLEQVDLVFERNPELSKIGTIEEYATYLQEIFPNSRDKAIYWHGSDSDFSEGFNSSIRGKGSGSPHITGEFYLAKQAWTVLQYVSGINRSFGPDINGFNHWNKLWWELKEIMSNGRRENNNWKDLIIGPNNVRQAIPNKKGIFNRDSGGTNGKWLKERKADYGYQDKTDAEFFRDVFGIEYGKDTFNTWTQRNAEIFKSLVKTEKGIYPAIINATNPIRESGKNTYYEPERGLLTQARAKGNDAILGANTDNEFHSDVAVVFNAKQNVHFLGTTQDVTLFKQWLEKNRASKVVDENGEPLVVYHGGTKDIIAFRTSSIDNSNTGYGYYKDPVTGKEIPLDSNRAMFFSDNKYVGESYATMYAIQYFNKVRNKVDSLISSFYDGKASIDKNVFKSLEDFYDLLEIISEYNPRFIALKEHIKNLQKEGQRLKPNEVDAARQLFIEVLKVLDKNSSSYNMNISSWNNILHKGKSIIDTYNSEEGIQRLLNGEIPKEIKKEWDIYKKIEKHRESQGLSKVSNYEEVYQWLSAGLEINSNSFVLKYNGKELIISESRKAEDTPISKMSKEELKDLFKRAKEANIKEIKERNQENEAASQLKNKSQEYEVFLNIRNPLSHDYEGTSQGQGYKYGKHPFGYVAARQVNKAINEGHDGVIYENLYDPYLANNYGVFNPNQIKSATENVGTFDSNNPDIRYRIVPNSSFEILDANVKESLLKKGWTQEQFDSISQEERDQAVKCIAF